MSTPETFESAVAMFLVCVGLAVTAAVVGKALRWFAARRGTYPEGVVSVTEGPGFVFIAVKAGSPADDALAADAAYHRGAWPIRCTVCDGPVFTAFDPGDAGMCAFCGEIADLTNHYPRGQAS